MVYRTAPFSMTLKDPIPRFQGQAILWGWISMSMSIMKLYSAESWSISTALCVLSDNAEISSFSTVVGSRRLSGSEFQTCDREGPTTKSTEPVTWYCQVMSTGQLSIVPGLWALSIVAYSVCMYPLNIHKAQLISLLSTSIENVGKQMLNVVNQNVLLSNAHTCTTERKCHHKI